MCGGRSQGRSGAEAGIPEAVAPPLVASGAPSARAARSRASRSTRAHGIRGCSSSVTIPRSQTSASSRSAVPTVTPGAAKSAIVRTVRASDAELLTRVSLPGKLRKWGQ